MPMPLPYKYITAARKATEDMSTHHEARRFAVMDLLNKAMDALCEYRGMDEEIVGIVTRRQIGDIQRLAGITEDYATEARVAHATTSKLEAFIKGGE